MIDSKLSQTEVDVLIYLIQDMPRTYDWFERLTGIDEVKMANAILDLANKGILIQRGADLKDIEINYSVIGASKEEIPKKKFKMPKPKKITK